jgi:hypothetical protein
VSLSEPSAHYPICGECGRPWPCLGERQQRQIRRLNHELERMCPVCRKPVENGHMSAIIDGRHYHMAKRHRRCRAAALALDPRLRVVYD